MFLKDAGLETVEFGFEYQLHQLTVDLDAFIFIYLLIHQFLHVYNGNKTKQLHPNVVLRNKTILQISVFFMAKRDGKLIMGKF